MAQLGAAGPWRPGEAVGRGATAPAAEAAAGRLGAERAPALAAEGLLRGRSPIRMPGTCGRAPRRSAPQNFRPARFSVPQLGQVICAPPSARADGDEGSSQLELAAAGILQAMHVWRSCVVRITVEEASTARGCGLFEHARPRVRRLSPLLARVSGGSTMSSPTLLHVVRPAGRLRACSPSWTGRLSGVQGSAARARASRS